MTTEQQTRLIYDVIRETTLFSEIGCAELAQRIAAKLGEGEKGAEKSKAQEAAEKLLLIRECDGQGKWAVSLEWGPNLIVFVDGDRSVCERARKPLVAALADHLASFGAERAAEAVAAERERIITEILGSVPADPLVPRIVRIVEGVGK